MLGRFSFHTAHAHHPLSHLNHSHYPLYDVTFYPCNQRSMLKNTTIDPCIRHLSLLFTTSLHFTSLLSLSGCQLSRMPMLKHDRDALPFIYDYGNHRHTHSIFYILFYFALYSILHTCMFYTRSHNCHALILLFPDGSCLLPSTYTTLRIESHLIEYEWLVAAFIPGYLHRAAIDYDDINATCA